MHHAIQCSFLGLFLLFTAASGSRYDPTWASLDTRPLPGWYDESKVGIFIHWGVFSVPSFGIDNGNTGSGEWFWNLWQSQNVSAYVNFVAETEGGNFAYPDYASRFTAEFFNATEWATLFKASGARYIVPTAKHHEGWCNWPSATSFNWNSQDVGPRRDLIGELGAAVKQEGLHFGVYHSLYEWYNPLYLADEASNFTTTTFISKTMGELVDLVTRYEPELVWSDGDNGPESYWNAPANFLAWLVNDSPVADTVVFNDRWSPEDACKHGSYFTCTDRYLPSSKQNHKWENAFTIDMDSWGFRRNADVTRYLSLQNIVQTVVETVSLGGNALINIGPAHDGTIPPIFQERLLGLGAWLGVNGDSIYATTPWREQNETAASAWYTLGSDAATVYVTIFNWPASGLLTLELPITTPQTLCALLGGVQNLTWVPLSGSQGTPGLAITMPAVLPGSYIASAPAWTISLLHVT